MRCGFVSNCNAGMHAVRRGLVFGHAKQRKLHPVPHEHIFSGCWSDVVHDLPEWYDHDCRRVDNVLRLLGQLLLLYSADTSVQAMLCQCHIRRRHGRQLALYLQLQGELHGLWVRRCFGVLLRSWHQGGRVHLRSLRPRHLLGDHQRTCLHPLLSWDVRRKGQLDLLCHLSAWRLGVLYGAVNM